MDSQKINLPEPNNDLSSDLNNSVQDAINHTNTSTSQIQEPKTERLENLNLIAKDSDLIEKHWIDEIKKIFHVYRGNPYQQLQAYNNLKQDYLLKRFNKTIKTLNK
jgi:hypothetical protein